MLVIRLLMKKLFSFMKEKLGDAVGAVRFSITLGAHPVCLASEGELSIEMERVLNSLPTGEDEKVKAELVLNINLDHPIAARLRTMYDENRDRLAACTRILYAQARLIGGMSPENPTEISNLICDLML